MDPIDCFLYDQCETLIIEVLIINEIGITSKYKQPHWHQYACLCVCLCVCVSVCTPKGINNQWQDMM